MPLFTAVATIERATGWTIRCSNDAASCRASSSEIPKVTISVNSGCPTVKVPVLSKTTVSI